MKRASVTEAKNRLSALLDRVRRGESVLVEDRGVAIAQITPVARGDQGLDADRLSALERLGILRPAHSPKPSRTPLTPPPEPTRPEALSDLVSDERGGGW